ncbi:MAG: hypothetical protein ACVCEJ_00135 [Candidatus Izemoplasmataceae bacterium]
MKKLITIVTLFLFSLSLIGCDIIQEEIDRAESLALEDYTVDIPQRNILLKITSNADEQVVESVMINGESYELVAQGDDWYLLEDIPIAKSYDIGNVYYVTAIGATVPYDVDFTITIDEAIDQLPAEYYVLLEDTAVLDGYTFTASEDALVTVESELVFTIDEVDDWVWLILVDELPVFAVVEHEGEIYIIKAPENTADYLGE